MLDEGRMPAAVNAVGREECLEELLAFTQEKNVHARLTARG
jgi:hypothetical protein